MNPQNTSTDAPQTSTPVERRGDRDLVAVRTFDAPRTAVFRAWSEPAQFRRWWMPKSAKGVSLVSCDRDVRTGRTYRLEFGAGGSKMVAFHGKYLDVVPGERIVWTNDEGDDGAITTVTFADQAEKTLLQFHEVYPTSEAREDALAGSAAALPEQLEQLAALLSGEGG